MEGFCFSVRVFTLLFTPRVLTLRLFLGGESVDGGAGRDHSPSHSVATTVPSSSGRFHAKLFYLFDTLCFWLCLYVSCAAPTVDGAFLCVCLKNLAAADSVNSALGCFYLSGRRRSHRFCVQAKCCDKI